MLTSSHSFKQNGYNYLIEIKMSEIKWPIDRPLFLPECFFNRKI